MSYDPQEFPEQDPESGLKALKLGLKQIFVYCHDDAAEPPSLKFIAYVAFVPRQGETLVLEDGNLLTIFRVANLVFTNREHKLISTSVAVHAVMQNPPQPADVEGGSAAE